jgi:hypothetical protein
MRMTSEQLGTGVAEINPGEFVYMVDVDPTAYATVVFLSQDGRVVIHALGGRQDRSIPGHPVMIVPVDQADEMERWKAKDDEGPATRARIAYDIARVDDLSMTVDDIGAERWDALRAGDVDPTLEEAFALARAWREDSLEPGFQQPPRDLVREVERLIGEAVW